MAERDVRLQEQGNLCDGMAWRPRCSTCNRTNHSGRIGTGTGSRAACAPPCRSARTQCGSASPAGPTWQRGAARRPRVHAGRPATPPAYQIDEFRARGYWLAEVSFLWPLMDLVAVKNQAIYAGFGCRPPGSTTARSRRGRRSIWRAVFVGGPTPIGTLSLGVGGSPTAGLLAVARPADRQGLDTGRRPVPMKRATYGHRSIVPAIAMPCSKATTSYTSRRSPEGNEHESKKPCDSWILAPRICRLGSMLCKRFVCCGARRSGRIADRRCKIDPQGYQIN